MPWTRPATELTGEKDDYGSGRRLSSSGALAQQLHDEGRRCGRRAGEVHEPRFDSDRFLLILEGVHDRNREEWRGAEDVTRPFIQQCKAIADRVTKRSIARPAESIH